MNYYGFAHPVRAFIARQDIMYDPINIDGLEFKAWLDEARAKIPFSNQLSQLNQLDSHDTARFITLVDGDKRKMNIALAMLMTYVGTPCIYYGSEVGLEGGLDPDNRRCFPWNEIESSQWLSLYQQWIKIRKQCKPLQSGCIQWLHCTNNQLAYARVLGREAVVVMINLSGNECSIDLPMWQLGLEVSQVISLLDDTEQVDYKGHISVNMSAQSCKLWRLK